MATGRMPGVAVTASCYRLTPREDVRREADTAGGPGEGGIAQPWARPPGQTRRSC